MTVQAIPDATDDGLMELLIERDHNQLAPPSGPGGCTSERMDLPASDVPGIPSPG